MAQHPEIAHLFFDLDRTLWDFDTNSTEALREVFEHFELSQKTNTDFETFKVIYTQHNDACWEQYRKNLITKEALRYVRFDYALRDVGIQQTQLAHAMGELYVAVSPEKTKLIDGALPMLLYLQNHYHLHIITNGFEEVQYQKMESSGLQPFFKHIITSEKVGKRKPDPAIFDFALAEAKAKPQESAMIGDDFEADIMGALRKGLLPVWFAPETSPSSSDTIKHIVHLNQLADYF